MDKRVQDSHQQSTEVGKELKSLGDEPIQISNSSDIKLKEASRELQEKGRKVCMWIIVV